jgi:hypothetical protein
LNASRSEQILLENEKIETFLIIAEGLGEVNGMRNARKAEKKRGRRGTDRNGASGGERPAGFG